VIRLAIGLAVLAGGLPRAQEENRPKLPPYRVAIKAKTKFLPFKKAGEFQERLKQISVYARQSGREAVPGDNAGWEIWRFEISGESKFDISIITRAFGDVQCGRYELTITGTAEQDPKSKIIFVTSYGGKVKVKLMNPRKNESNPDQEVPDEVGKVSGKMAEGKVYFTVRGEIFSHGGTLAILLASSEEASPPPPSKEDKK